MKKEISDSKWFSMKPRQGRVRPLTAGQVGESFKTAVNQEDD